MSSSARDNTEARNRSHNQGRQDRNYTPEQHAAVQRVIRCEATAYYEILSISSPSNESEIKKAYRKLALTMHPDKNGAPQADEAFKRVNKAFQILGDKEKKKIYDQTGRDPDSRSAGPSASGFASGFGGGPRGQGAPGVFTAEDIFSSFFGGPAAGGGGFSGGGMPFSTFHFGGPGVHFQTSGMGFEDDLLSQLFGFGGARRQQQQQRQQRPRNGSSDGPPDRGILGIFLQLLPFIFLFSLPWLISVLTGGDATALPKFRFDVQPPYTAERTTPKYHVPFFVNPREVKDLSASKLRRLERHAETTFVTRTRASCAQEYTEQQEALHSAVGWWSTDEEAYREALNMPLPHCELLDTLGIRARE